MSSRQNVAASQGVLEVEWPMFGELARALALRVVREFDPEIVVGIANAGAIPGAVIASILDREFHSILISRRYRSDSERDTPAVLGAVPHGIRARRVLLVDGTCESGETMRLAIASLVNGGAEEVRTAVVFRTGAYEPDFHALATESVIVLPWDREVMLGDQLVPNPLYASAARGLGGTAGGPG
ncbi:MAG: phosphoribosyltransferase [Gemmatimonadaceae bacterium]